MPTSVAPSNVVTSPGNPAMPAYREAAFKTLCAKIVRDAGGSADATLFRIAAEQAALVHALADPEFVQSFAQLFQQAINARMGQPFAVPPEEAVRAVKSILEHRIADARYFEQMLKRADAVEAIKAEAAQPAPPIKPYELPPEKQRETWERCVQESDPRGPEFATHALGYALGQSIEHEALAQAYKSPAMAQTLVTALQVQMPAVPANELTQLAGEWLSAREKPATATAEGLKPTGALYQQAAARADQLQYGAKAQTERMERLIQKAMLDRI